MADNNSSQPIPEGWILETKTTKDGSQLRYVCSETGQHFYNYKDMMRYVKYAKKAELPIYLSSFHYGKDDKINLDALCSQSILDDVKVVDLEELMKSWKDAEEGESDLPKSADVEGKDIPQDFDMGEACVPLSIDDMGEGDVPQSFDDLGEGYIPQFQETEFLPSGSADAGESSLPQHNKTDFSTDDFSNWDWWFRGDW